MAMRGERSTSSRYPCARETAAAQAVGVGIAAWVTSPTDMGSAHRLGHRGGSLLCVPGPMPDTAGECGPTVAQARGTSHTDPQETDMSTIVEERTLGPVPSLRGTEQAPADTAPPRVATRRRPVADGIRAGLRDMAPVTVAIIPFAMVLGVAIDASIVPDLAGTVMAPIIYAGSSNFAALSVLDAGGAAITAVFTALVVNARFTMYGAALAARFAGQPRWFRWLAPWMIVDQTFALASARDERDPAWFRGYWIACGALIGVVYTAMVVVGVLLGPVVPSGVGLEFTIPALFVAMTVGHAKNRPAAVAALTSAAVTALALELPHGLGLLAGALAGAAAGVIARRMS